MAVLPARLLGRGAWRAGPSAPVQVLAEREPRTHLSFPGGRTPGHLGVGRDRGRRGSLVRRRRAGSVLRQMSHPRIQGLGHGRPRKSSIPLDYLKRFYASKRSFRPFSISSSTPTFSNLGRPRKWSSSRQLRQPDRLASPSGREVITTALHASTRELALALLADASLGGWVRHGRESSQGFARFRPKLTGASRQSPRSPLTCWRPGRPTREDDRSPQKGGGHRPCTRKDRV